VVGVGALLPECFLALAVLGEDERTIVILIFDPLNSEDYGSGRIMIIGGRDSDLPRLVVLAVEFRRWRFAV
jgi:hypothetical protein